MHSVFLFIVVEKWTTIGHSLFAARILSWPQGLFLSHGVACLQWPLLSLSDIILSCHVSQITETLLACCCTGLIFPWLSWQKKITIMCVSSWLMAMMIISVPQIFNADFLVCEGPVLDVQKRVPILAVQDPVSFVKERKPCGCKQKCLLYSCWLWLKVDRGCVILTPAPLLSALVFRLVSGEEEKKLGC